MKQEETQEELRALPKEEKIRRIEAKMPQVDNGVRVLKLIARDGALLDYAAQMSEGGEVDTDSPEYVAAVDELAEKIGDLDVARDDLSLVLTSAKYCVGLIIVLQLLARAQGKAAPLPLPDLSGLN